MAEYPPNIPLAVIVGAIGAAQIATVLATPLPKFEKGGTTSGGAFVWGEKGTEIAIEPSGRTYASPSHASIGVAPSGTKIIPNHLIRPGVSQYQGGEQVPWKEVIAAINRNKPQQQKRPVVNVHVSNDNLVRRMSR